MSHDDTKKDGRTSFAFAILAAVAAIVWVGLGTAMVERRAAKAVASAEVVKRD